MSYDLQFMKLRYEIYKNSKFQKKTNEVNKNKDILLRFKENMYPAVHIFVGTFFCLSNLRSVISYWKWLFQPNNFDW